MNLGRIISVGALAMFCTTFVLAADSQPAGKPATGPAVKIPPGYWSILASVVEADDAQRAKIKELVDAEKAAREGLVKQSKQIDEAIAAAQESGDKEAAKKARDDKKAVQDEIEKVKDKTKSDVMDILTPVQRQKHASHELRTWTKQRLSKLELTDQQDAKIKEMAQEPGRKILQSKGDSKAIGEIRQAFLAEVKEQVLSLEQRKTLEASARGPRSKPAASGKAK